MKNFLYLIATGAIFLLTACSDNDESANRHYAVEQKKRMEVELHQSLERNIERLKLEPQEEY